METVDATAMLRFCSGSSVDAVLQQCHSFARELPSTRFRRNGSLRSGGRRRYYDAAVLLRNFRRPGGRRRYYDGFCFTNSVDVGDWRSPTVPWRLCMTCNTTNTTATINRNDPKKQTVRYRGHIRRGNDKNKRNNKNSSSAPITAPQVTNLVKQQCLGCLDASKGRRSIERMLIQAPTLYTYDQITHVMAGTGYQNSLDKIHLVDPHFFRTFAWSKRMSSNRRSIFLILFFKQNDRDEPTSPNTNANRDTCGEVLSQTHIQSRTQTNPKRPSALLPLLNP